MLGEDTILDSKDLTWKVAGESDSESDDDNDNDDNSGDDDANDDGASAVTTFGAAVIAAVASLLFWVQVSIRMDTTGRWTEARKFGRNWYGSMPVSPLTCQV